MENKLDFNIIEIGPGKIPYIVISSSEQHKNIIDFSGKISVKTEKQLQLLDIYESLETGVPAIKNYIVQENDPLISKAKILDYKELANEIVELTNIAVRSMTEASAAVSLYSSAVSAIRYICNDKQEFQDDKATLIINGQTDALAYLNFESISGEQPKLSNSEIEKIGSVIIQCIYDYININEDDPAEIKDLINELEMEIISALPPSISGEKIKINTQKVIEEIKRIRKAMKRNDTEEEDFDNG